MPADLMNEFAWRGLLHQTTGDDVLRAHLASPRRIYAGFDPTADSLTVGNLVPIMALVRAQRMGHTPVALMGGGTGLIGDPSGKSDERQLLSRERVEANVRAIAHIFEPLLDFAGKRALMLNNIDWLGGLGYLEVLRDVGKHFSVNMMIQKDSVRDRLHGREQGISYTEFSYMILQAYDFYHLHKSMGVTVQMGASDQWGNIVCGCDLIRRLSPAAESFGLTWPLITKADGTKFGKTESGAVWLTKERTSPYAFYQFWLNTPDEDAVRFLKVYTLLDRAAIDALAAEHAADPAKRSAQRELARHMTTLLHGQSEQERAEAAAQALFSGEIAALPEATLREALSSAPSSTHAKTQLSAGVSVLDLLVTTKLAQSKREAKEFLSGGSVMVNGRKAGADETLTTAHLLHGSMIALRRGKKQWHLTTWE